MKVSDENIEAWKELKLYSIKVLESCANSGIKTNELIGALPLIAAATAILTNWDIDDFLKRFTETAKASYNMFKLEKALAGIMGDGNE